MSPPLPVPFEDQVARLEMLDVDRLGRLWDRLEQAHTLGFFHDPALALASAYLGSIRQDTEPDRAGRIKEIPAPRSTISNACRLGCRPTRIGQQGRIRYPFFR